MDSTSSSQGFIFQRAKEEEEETKHKNEGETKTNAHRRERRDTIFMYTLFIEIEFSQLLITHHLIITAR